MPNQPQTAWPSHLWLLASGTSGKPQVSFSFGHTSQEEAQLLVRPQTMFNRPCLILNQTSVGSKLEQAEFSRRCSGQLLVRRRVTGEQLSGRNVRSNPIDARPRLIMEQVMKMTMRVIWKIFDRIEAPFPAWCATVFQNTIHAPFWQTVTLAYVLLQYFYPPYTEYPFFQHQTFEFMLKGGYR